jgi:hypothetical protein
MNHYSAGLYIYLSTMMMIVVDEEHCAPITGSPTIIEHPASTRHLI